MNELFAMRPLLIALTGSNGAGKSTFYESHLKGLGLPFVNADRIALHLQVDAYEAARIATQLRHEWLKRQESFIFETVFSDPVGEKLEYLRLAQSEGYTVVVFFVGLCSVERSIERVAMRAAQGGHDVPDGKLQGRFGRTLVNLRRTVDSGLHLRIYDNSDLRDPYRHVADFVDGRCTWSVNPLPEWLRHVLAGEP